MRPIKYKLQKPYLTDQERWEAVIHREKNADYAFVYTLETTGVYCRPSLPGTTCTSRERGISSYADGR